MLGDNDLNEVKDVQWESVVNEEGKIKFRNNNRHGRIKGFFKLVCIIIASATIGGAAGAYIVDKKYSTRVLTPNNQSIFQQGDTKTADIPKNAINKVAETVGPAVVGISNKVDGFFGVQNESSGSGIIFDPNGYIVTNNHVIEGSEKIVVRLSSGKTLDAKLVGADTRSDLAVIKVEAQNLPVAKFGDSSKVKVGDLAIAIGNPLGEEFAGSVTAGIISALNRKISFQGAIYKVLQTDAAINPGNSGGALCNEAGEVIGINSLKLGTEQGAEGMGFAISINEAKDIVKSLMNYGKVVSRPFIGIYGQSIISDANKVQGVYVKEVVKDSGAYKAGIKPTDIIVELDGKKVTKFEDLADIIDSHKIGDTISCKVWRNGKTVQYKIVLSELKDTNQ